MLSGEDLGRAIAQAIDKKISSGAVKTKAEIARHFKIKAPSIYDWIKRGSISKEKLPELWRFFSDVVGPEHWGLDQYPALGTAIQNSESIVENEIISTLYHAVSDEKRAVIDFFLLKDGAPLPEWIDSDARAYADSLELKAKRWLERNDRYKKAKQARA